MFFNNYLINKIQTFVFLFSGGFQIFSLYGFKDSCKFEEPSWIQDYFQKQTCFVSCFLEVDVFCGGGAWLSLFCMVMVKVIDVLVVTSNSRGFDTHLQRNKWNGSWYLSYFCMESPLISSNFSLIWFRHCIELEINVIHYFFGVFNFNFFFYNSIVTMGCGNLNPAYYLKVSIEL